MNADARTTIPPAHEKAVQVVTEACRMSPEDAREYLEMLATAGHHFMRAKFGVAYTRGFLQSALADLDQPAIFTLREPH